MKTAITLTALAASLAIAANLWADDTPAAPKGNAAEGKMPEGKAPPTMRMGGMQFNIPGVEWTDEQKTQIEEIKKEQMPKMMEYFQKAEAMLTDEQKKARIEAVKTAKTAGKNPKEMMEAIEAALNLTEEQKTQRSELRKEMEASQKELMQKIMGLLTPEQKESMMKKAMEGKMMPKPEGK